MNFQILNLEKATFDCTYGRGCEGVCCRNGRPPVYPDEAERIDANLHKFLPGLRPRARVMVEREGYVSRRRKSGAPMMRVVDGWCVFFHHGCVLHRAGVNEQDKFRYKPWSCAVFPLARDARDRWYVRQHGVASEKWELACLSPSCSSVPAAISLRDEIALIASAADSGNA